MSIDKASFDLFSKKAPETKPAEPIIQKSFETQIPRNTERTADPIIEQKIEAHSRSSIEEKTTPLKIKSKTISKRVEVKTNKYESFLPVTLRLKQEDFMDLKHIENSIMRSRSKNGSEDRERITTNSILRSLVSSFINRADLFDFEDIDNEEILNQRIQKVFKPVPNNINQ
jgi:hypothetical protein